MQTLKLNSKGADVVKLQNLLNNCGYKVSNDGIFGKGTNNAVLAFQKANGLAADGIVGHGTWTALIAKATQTPPTAADSLKLTEADYVRAAGMMKVEVAAIKAVKTVESGSRGGFFEPGKPAILFEGHIFWRQLKKKGINPEMHVKGNENILYPKWTKGHYAGGIKEYDRLEKAMNINVAAARESASWGMFQIMGFNYKACGCSDVNDFVNNMMVSEGRQLDLFVKFLIANGWDKYLRALDWAGFARHYNGPGYAANKYDQRLLAAYNKNK